MGPHMGSVVTMIGPCLTQLYFQTNLSLEILNTETNRSKGHVKGVLSLWVHKRALFGYESAILAKLSQGYISIIFGHV